jgi:formylglycine-generating enzyme required for sulfatase activity
MKTVVVLVSALAVVCFTLGSVCAQTTCTNSLGMSFVLIPAGTFTMGSPLDELGRSDDETQHEVTLSNSYYMQTTEVTQAQWEAVMGDNPSSFSGCSDCPVETVSWNDAQDFIAELNALGEGTYRLPTEAEWEYACRAGSSTAFANGEITKTDCGYDPNLDQIGWYCYNADRQTHPGAQKDPNAWGLYDMHGNVWEWCQDWYGTYPTSAVTDPTGPSSGTNRVLRGGSGGYSAGGARSARRASTAGDIRYRCYGLRVVREFSEPSAPTEPSETVPAAPELNVTTSGITLTLSWNTVSGADGYTLFYAPYPEAGEIGQIDMGGQTSESIDLWPGAAFYVAVQAYNSTGAGDVSNIEHFEIP